MSKIKLGCRQSKLDGTEIKYQAKPNFQLPEAYTYISVLSPVINQGYESTCVPCSISAHLNWNRNMDTKKVGVDNGVSIKELYSIRAEKNEEGMTIKEALHYLYKHGVSSKAGNMKIRQYAMIGSELALKQAIIFNGPCIGALRVYNDSKEFWNRQMNNEFLGGHAISIVGWNKAGFIIRNSWGSNWGNHGYTTLKYNDFNKFVELWTIID